MNRRRFALYGTLALCIVATLVGVTLNAGQKIAPSALAADHSAAAEAKKHPAIFTFEATRTSGSTVVFSGEYEVWNTVDAAYAPGAPLAAVEIQDGSSWATLGMYPTDDSGHFSGSERIGGAYPLRARGTDASNTTIGISQSVMLTYEAPSKMAWSSVLAVEHDGVVTVSGNANGVWARDPFTHHVDYLGAYPYAIAVQAEVDGVWTTLTHTTPNADGEFSTMLPPTTATTFRVKVHGSLDYRKSTEVVSLTKGF